MERLLSGVIAENCMVEKKINMREIIMFFFMKKKKLESSQKYVY